MTRRIDFNSDESKGFGRWLIADVVEGAVMPLISSVNIATGFHLAT